jgi:peptide/nickel transport system ATP-binding protein
MNIAAPSPLLELHGLSVSYRTRYREVPAVVDLSLLVHSGEGLALVGETGCGKTTIAMAILRHLGDSGRVVSGEIRFRGCDIATLDENALRRLRGGEIAMVYQQPATALNPCMRIGEQLAEVPIVHYGRSRSQARNLSLEMLAEVQLADAKRLLDAYPHQLSGGQQQRIVIAMALLGKPSLLILDEPTTALDATVEAGITRLIRQLRQRAGTAQICISHNLALVREICERVCVLYAGEVVETGPLEEVFDHPRHPYTQALLRCIPSPPGDGGKRRLAPIRGRPPDPEDRSPGCTFAPRCDHFRKGPCDRDTVPLQAVKPDHAVRCLRWQEIAAVPHAERSIAPETGVFGEPLLEARDLCKHYAVENRFPATLLCSRDRPTVKANDRVSLTVRRGQTLAIVGESGCGKSTFARVVAGLETATSGQIRFAGREIGKSPARKRSGDQRSSLQMVFQNPDETLNPCRAVGAQIARAVHKLSDVRGRLQLRTRALKLLETVRLSADLYDRRPHQLSGGQRQRVALARALAGIPKLVVADEPFSALDMSVAAALVELFLAIQRRHGTAFLLISHDLATVRYLADRVVVMYLGQVMESGTTAEVFAPPYHPYTEALLAAVPVADGSWQKRKIVLEGQVPSAVNPPPGCPFASRCPRRIGPLCDREPPPSMEAAAGHLIACHIPLAELRLVEPLFRPVS